MPQAFINRLVNSIRRRCTAMVNADGGHTRYYVGPLAGNFYIQKLMFIDYDSSIFQTSISATSIVLMTMRILFRFCRNVALSDFIHY